MKYENRDEFLRYLKSLEEVEEVQTYQEECHYIPIPENIGGIYGGASMTENGEELGVFTFDITLGPANSKKLVEFLKSLPPEPEYEDEDPAKGYFS